MDDMQSGGECQCTEEPARDPSPGLGPAALEDCGCGLELLDEFAAELRESLASYRADATRSSEEVDVRLGLDWGGTKAGP